MYKKLLMVGVLVIISGNSWLLAQAFVFQGLESQVEVSRIISQLEAKYGAGQWLEANTHYQIVANFLGQAANVEVFITDNHVNKLRFSWQEQQPYQQSLGYWRGVLYELLAQPQLVDFFDGTHSWRLEQLGLALVWQHAQLQREVTAEAPQLSGKLRGEGKSKRLYSIDGEEYESSYELDFSDVTLGEKKSQWVSVVNHTIEMTFFDAIVPVLGSPEQSHTVADELQADDAQGSEHD